MKFAKTLIVVPVYNGEGFIERTLDSAVAQTVKTAILVVDNRSIDKTQAIVRKYAQKYPQIKLVVNSKNYGRTGNWNRCLDLFEKSPYQYIKYLFAGDEIFPGFVQETEKVFTRHSDVGAIATPYIFRDLEGREHRDTSRHGNRKFSLKETAWINLYEGGILGAIICDSYNKKFIQGYRFNELYVGKSDFDFAVLSRGKAYFLDKELSRFHLDAHRTFHKSLHYSLEMESAYNRSFWLEKQKNLFSDAEYEQIKEKILIDSAVNNVPYFKIKTFVKLIGRLIWKNVS